ncbi:MAG: NUDIX domain-containing protein [Candidatus Brockarchaeota archaeon]|nr:NUDIX domain-containing protein [Candidatus Brockarchaeota archaeon]
MKEKSAGFIVFTKENSEVKYLFLKVRGRLDFPKGNIDEAEDELAAALRELREESGIDKIRVIPGFRKVLNYYYRRNDSTLVSKTLILFLGEALEKNVSISWEHEGFEWLSLDEAIMRIKYPRYKEVLKEAEEFRVRKTEGSLGKWFREAKGNEGQLPPTEHG